MKKIEWCIKEKRAIVGIIAAVIITVLLVLVCILQGKVTGSLVKENMEVSSNNTEEMRYELAEIAGYLSKVDKTIIDNQGALKTILNKSFSQHLSNTTDSVSEVEEQLITFMDIYHSDNVGIADSLKQLMREIGIARKELEDCREKLAVEIAESEDNAKVRQEKTETALIKIKEKIIKANQQMSEAYKELLNLLDKMAREGKVNVEELSKQITDTGKGAMDYLSEAEENILKQVSETEQELVVLLIDIENSLSKLLSNEMENLINLLSLEMEATRLVIEKEVQVLSEKMEALHIQIEITQTELEGMLSGLDNNAVERQEEIREDFRRLQLAIEQIQTEFNDAHGEVGRLLEDIKNLSEENHMELINTLSEMEKGMEISNEQNLTQLQESMNKMSIDYSNSINNLKSEISQNFSSMDLNVSSKLQQINANVTSKYENLSTALNRGEEGLRAYLSDSFSAVNQKLESVFTRVSDGKKLLASTLLTKGVSCRPDATFEEIKDAILAISQKIVIGVEQIPGVITYDYHNHLDGKGVHVALESVSSDRKGGCFTKSVFHAHTGNYKEGGGCYSKEVVHNHNNSCYKVIRNVREITGHWFTGEGTGHGCCSNAHGENYAKYRYVDNVYEDGVLVSSKEGVGDLGYCCGLCIVKKANSKAYDNTTSSIICGYSEGLNGYELGCGMSTSSVIAYKPDCGYTEGQIIAAHIVYTETAFNLSKEVSEEIDVDQKKEVQVEAETEIVEKETVSGNIANTEEAAKEAEAEIVEKETVSGNIANTEEVAKEVEAEIVEKETVSEKQIEYSY